MKTVYLAGPDVFFPDAAAHFDALAARCASFGLRGVRPSDGDSPEPAAGDDRAERIYRANVALIRSCDAVLANLMPFRNALEPDSGTVFELGMAVALGKPVVGYLPGRHVDYAERVAEAAGLRRDAQGLAWDARWGFLIEEFGQPMNLMLACSTALFETADAALDHLARQLGGDPPHLGVEAA